MLDTSREGEPLDYAVDVILDVSYFEAAAPRAQLLPKEDIDLKSDV
ncbi:hypothetical protein PO883_32835 [Massilia sp. DJPM01]|nr:hypothetical protein [Massilia sp. DJPM01]MDM5181961.1 hypothetical protein [Massilia sp. DJPM01]